MKTKPYIIPKFVCLDGKFALFKIGGNYHGNTGGHIGSLTRTQLGIYFHAQMGQYAGNWAADITKWSPTRTNNRCFCKCSFKWLQNCCKLKT